MTLDEIRATLREAVANETSVRFGHEIARTIYTALLDVDDAPAEPAEHEHQWRIETTDRIDSGYHVLQSCACGDVRTLAAEVAT